MAKCKQKCIELDFGLYLDTGHFKVTSMNGAYCPPPLRKPGALTEARGSSARPPLASS